MGTPVVTVGSFDGVHCGHRMLLQRVMARANENHCRSLVVTFRQHPRMTLATATSAPWLLNTTDEKINLLTQAGIDDVLLLRFDRELAQMTAASFIGRIISEKLKARCWVMGKDHSFGKDRSGNAGNLASLAAALSLQTEVVELKRMEHKISSSFIRKSLWEGNLETANRMLGYHYMISGEVVKGNRLGHTIGFPTANIVPDPDKLLPGNGVYRVNVLTGDTAAQGMLYIGRRTMLNEDDAQRHVEVHIFDFDRNIYGQRLQVSLTHRIRGDLRFENIGQLQQQLHRDKQAILQITS
jgi:riboflavin kinase/FMN adenylyltransferase